MSSQYIYSTHRLAKRYPPDKQVLADIQSGDFARPSSERSGGVLPNHVADAASGMFVVT